MKRNNITTAVIAGIAGVAGIASVSNAVNLNSDGLGQVLIYPYYTVNNGIDTLISVVNTTDQVKAVKVRFLEGKNSRECLDFNLYMSPYDVWTAALVATTSTIGGHVGENSVKLITNDNSCIAPNFISTLGQEFLPFGYDPGGDGSAASGYDLQGLDMQRCTEGHFEMIEMGNVVNTASNGGAASGVTHAGGVPGNCGVVDANWNPGGAWVANNNDGILNPDGTGGLFGSTSLIDVAGGVDMTYNADAIQSYSTLAQHSDPSSLDPNVGSGNQIQSVVFDGSPTAIVTDWSTDPVQAVSAVYMHNNVYGEYVISDSIGAETEWVVTFPTKFAYVDAFVTPFPAVPYEPFVAALSPAIGACESFGLGAYDREEQTPGGGPLIPSPRPPGLIGPVFCWETNVLEFFDADDVFASSHILGSNNNTQIKTGFDTGWVRIVFNQTTADNATATNYTGLPVTGFAVQKYTNSDLSGGVLANYAGLFKHRYSKSIGS